MNWYSLKLDEILRLTNSGYKGLSTIEAEEKLHKTGPNELLEGEKNHSRNIVGTVQGCDNHCFTCSSIYFGYPWGYY